MAFFFFRWLLTAHSTSLSPRLLESKKKKVHSADKRLEELNTKTIRSKKQREIENNLTFKYKGNHPKCFFCIPNPAVHKGIDTL